MGIELAHADGHGVHAVLHLLAQPRQFLQLRPAGDATGPQPHANRERRPEQGEAHYGQDAEGQRMSQVEVPGLALPAREKDQVHLG